MYAVNGIDYCLRHAATGRATLGRATKVSLVVGTVLFAINQLDVVLRGHVGAGVVAKIVLTYTVPFGVTLFSSLAASLQPRADGGQSGGDPGAAGAARGRTGRYRGRRR